MDDCFLHKPLTDMSDHLFESFAGMIRTIPAKGIPRAVELEGRMLEDDLEQKRTSLTEDVTSILMFSLFIKTTLQKVPMLPVMVSADHVALYRKVVMELIEAGELPYEAKEQFEATFSPRFSHALAA
jgi:hypothetical protein